MENVGEFTLDAATTEETVKEVSETPFPDYAQSVANLFSTFLSEVGANSVSPVNRSRIEVVSIVEKNGNVGGVLKVSQKGEKHPSFFNSQGHEISKEQFMTFGRRVYTKNTD